MKIDHVMTNYQNLFIAQRSSAAKIAPPLRTGERFAPIPTSTRLNVDISATPVISLKAGCQLPVDLVFQLAGV